MVIYVVAAALALWLALGTLAILACVVGARAENGWRAAMERQQSEQADEAQTHAKRRPGLKAAMF
ncbi:MAG: hypothetical protein H5T86_09285 [Armatimonadetes bacterium]|nr:hypothetical protein [Armatimonadota bacterium]